MAFTGLVERTSVPVPTPPARSCCSRQWIVGRSCGRRRPTGRGRPCSRPRDHSPWPAPAPGFPRVGRGKFYGSRSRVVSGGLGREDVPRGLSVAVLSVIDWRKSSRLSRRPRSRGSLRIRLRVHGLVTLSSTPRAVGPEGDAPDELRVLEALDLGLVSPSRFVASTSPASTSRPTASAAFAKPPPRTSRRVWPISPATTRTSVHDVQPDGPVRSRHRRRLAVGRGERAVDPLAIETAWPAEARPGRARASRAAPRKRPALSASQLCGRLRVGGLDPGRESAVRLKSDCGVPKRVQLASAPSAFAAATCAALGSTVAVRESKSGCRPRSRARRRRGWSPARAARPAAAARSALRSSASRPEVMKSLHLIPLAGSGTW